MDILLFLAVLWAGAGLIGLWLVLRCVHKKQDCLEVRDFIPGCFLAFILGPLMVLYALICCLFRNGKS